MTQKIIDIGKGSVHYLLTLLFAAIGVYVGNRISMAEMKKDINFLQKDVSRIEIQITSCKKEIDEMKPNVDILSWIHNVGTRDRVNNNHEHKHKMKKEILKR